ncbi:MAG: GMC family oxidoreductase N-terminal domain-containing protein [Bacteroidia bacterium]|nr:GMC family oxidoreductase N-terminal domain-containing protein [Bacteroidia bacterium]
MIKILANDGIDATGKKMLEAAGFLVDTNKIAQEDLKDKLQSYDAIIVRSATKVRKELIDACPNLKILLVEDGDYYPSTNLTNIELHAMDTMYQQHGFLVSYDSQIIILSGKTLGGGTTINWSCCLPLTTSVLKEWNDILSTTLQSNKTDDVVFGTEYHTSLQFILNHITIPNGASKKQRYVQQYYHNTMNQIAIQGYNALNYTWYPTQQNVHPVNAAGYICFGDKYGIKNDGIRSFLVPALRTVAKKRCGGVIHIVTNSECKEAVHLTWMFS